MAQHCRLRLFLDSDFAGDFEDSEATSGGIVIHLRKSDVCSYKLDVQETNFSVSPFNWFWNYFIGCWFAHARYSRCRSVGSGNRSPWFFFFEKKKFQHRETDRAMKSKQTPTPTPITKTHSKTRSRRVIQGGPRCHKRETFSLRSPASYFRGQWRCDQDDHWSQKSDDVTRVPKPQSFAGLVVWQNQFGPTKSELNMLTPKRQYMLTIGNFTRDERNHLLLFLINIMKLSMFSCSHSNPILNYKNHVEEVVARKKTWRIETCDGKKRSRRWVWYRRA